MLDIAKMRELCEEHSDYREIVVKLDGKLVSVRGIYQGPRDPRFPHGVLVLEIKENGHEKP